MKCQDCGGSDATVNLTQIINNEKVVLNLCKDCAAKRGFHSPLDNIPFPLANFLAGMMEAEKTAGESKAVMTTDLTCSKCGLTFSEFSRLGRFGCGNCYQTFREKLQPLLRKIHGSSLHRGKLPPMLSEDATIIKEQERLEDELKHAIDTEDFERAADLRDKLKSLKQTCTVEADKEKENV
ncbi:MAG: UvrB/UvrC motif-containing protein [Candidatus Zixiibacteriota bacterium]